MESELLGRTNKAYPPVWLSLAVPSESESIPALLDAAVTCSTVLDISSQPALWGGRLRKENCTLLASGGVDLERATDEKQAGDLTQAHLIQILSALGHEQIEFYFLKVRRALEEFQLAGAFAALEMARQEGHVSHIGLWVDGPALAVLPTWQFHDAFEVVILREEHLKTLAPFAAERRVGIVYAGDDAMGSYTWLATVRSADEAKRATSRKVAIS